MAPGKRWMDFDYDAYGQDNPNIEGHQGPGDVDNWYAGFGLLDIDAAKSMGYSMPQIRILAQRAQNNFGRTVGAKAQQWIDTHTTAAPWDYGGIGGAEFGRADLDTALAQGRSYNEIKGYADYATQHGIGVGTHPEQWLSENKDNYAYFDANQKREVMLQDQLDAEARAAEQWKLQQEELKRLNPRISSQNQAMQSKGSGGVAIKRSEDFRRAGGTRSTAQAGRGMFIESLNI